MKKLALIALGLMWLSFAGHLLYTAAGVGGSVLPASFFTDWLHHANYAAASVAAFAGATLRDRNRVAWLLLALALGTWSTGSIYWVIAVDGSDALVSLADALWLAFYPIVCCFLILRARQGMRQMPLSIWLDGLIAALAVAAFASLFVPAALGAGYPSPAIAAVYLAYPISDIGCLALIVGTLAVSGWRLNREWWLLGAGLSVFTIADLVYLQQNATGSYELGTILDAGWGTGMVLMAHAAFVSQPSNRKRPQLQPRRVLILPSCFVLLALAVLVSQSISGVQPVALSFAVLTVIVALARMNLTLREIRALSITRQQAITDDLTQLPNRRYLRERLTALVRAAEAGRRQGQQVSLSLVLIDLDRFKEVNDTLGHHAGDLVLRELAERFAAALAGRGTLARLGGDEFAILLGTEETEAAGLEMAGRVEAALAQPVSVLDVEVAIDASIGLAFYPRHGETAEDLFRHADIAMYQAKRDQSGYRIYSPDADEYNSDRLELVGALRRGIAAGELVLHYQPQIDLRSGAIVGVEALVRWLHPERGLLAPYAFLPAVEQTGLMKRLSAAVLDMAVAQLACWRERGIETTVAVNLCAQDLLDLGLVDEIDQRLTHHGVPASALRLEVTETLVMRDVARGVRVTDALHERGIGLALDDFGTGHSTLAYLKHLALEELKIDRTFVKELTSSRADTVIIWATVQMATELGLRTVAEGVEDAATHELLVNCGCDVAQGYLFARPLPLAEVEPLLVAGKVSLPGKAGPTMPSAERHLAAPRDSAAMNLSEC